MPDAYQEVAELGRSVRARLDKVDQKALALRPNSFEPTIAESIAMALLELERVEAEALPSFASEFLNRRLMRRLIERYPAGALTVELDRRLTVALNRMDRGNGNALARLRSLLLDLESVLMR